VVAPKVENLLGKGKNCRINALLSFVTNECSEKVGKKEESYLEVDDCVKEEFKG